MPPSSSLLHHRHRYLSPSFRPPLLRGRVSTRSFRYQLPEFPVRPSRSDRRFSHLPSRDGRADKVRRIGKPWTLGSRRRSHLQPEYPKDSGSGRGVKGEGSSQTRLRDLLLPGIPPSFLPDVGVGGTRVHTEDHETTPFPPLGREVSEVTFLGA